MLVLSFAAASQVFAFSAVIGVYKVANPLLLMVIAISMVRLQTTGSCEVNNLANYNMNLFVHNNYQFLLHSCVKYVCTSIHFKKFTAMETSPVYVQPMEL